MASRKPSVRHSSHNHPLRSHKAQAEEEIICSGCDQDLIDSAFKCTKSDCDYFLHKSCFELPREIQHKSHPDHPLKLLFSPPYESSRFGCNACDEYGSGFVYNCSICQYDVHIGCVSMPESVEREGHEHPLKLLYCSPYKKGVFFNCDVCQETVPDSIWSYYCKECDYGTHLHACAVEEPKSRGGGGGSSGGVKGGRGSAASELAAMLEAQREMERMQIRLDLEIQRSKIAKKSRKAMLKLI